MHTTNRRLVWAGLAHLALDIVSVAMSLAAVAGTKISGALVFLAVVNLALGVLLIGDKWRFCL